jgi:hypothetical protein
MVKRLRTRHWPRQYSTPSWPAAYNLACAYATICAYYIPYLEDNQVRDDAELKCLVRKVVTSLEFAITNPECEMDRPSEWIDNDPDFDCLRKRCDQFPEFKNFLDAQRRRDYPSSTTAIEHVMAVEKTAGRVPQDVRPTGAPYDISSPPRKIAIKAFNRSASGGVLALEESQVAEARRDPANYYLYVVDHVADPAPTAVRIIHGDLLTTILDRTPPKVSYCATFRTGEYDIITPP